MPRLIGPDFIGVQTEDLSAAQTFYADVLIGNRGIGLDVGGWLDRHHERAFGAAL